MKISIVAIPVFLLLFAGAAEAQKWNACSDQLAASTPAQDIGPQSKEANNPGFQRGYVDGIEIGGRDRQQGKSARSHKYDWYKSANRCYEKQYGDKDDYKREYRKGFDKGYSEAYGRHDDGRAE